MGESNSPQAIAISKFKTPYSHSGTSQFLNLPPELVLVIIRLLSREGQQIFSSLSQSCRQLALPFLFRELAYTKDVMKKIENINELDEDIKAYIRSVQTFCQPPDWGFISTHVDSGNLHWTKVVNQRSPSRLSSNS
jgi:hypothetical protein